MKHKNKVLSILLSVSLLITLVPYNVFAISSQLDTSNDIIAYGVCGENAIWEIDCNGTMTISGYGEMDYYRDSSNAPWYSYASNIKSIKFEKGITYIGSSSFEGYEYSQLENVYIANTVKRMGAYVFQSSSLKNVEFEANSQLENIGQVSFCGTNLEEIVIPDSVVEIDQYAFDRCNSLRTVIISSNLNNIGVDAFRNCNSLEVCYVSTDIAKYLVGEFAGAGLDKIKGKNITEDGLRYIFNNDNDVIVLGYDGEGKSVCIPAEIDGKTVVGIGAHSFSGNKEINRISLNESVMTIDDYAFYGCVNLETIDLGKTTMIGVQAFDGCTSLSHSNYDKNGFTIPVTMNTIGAMAFRNCKSLNEINILSSNILIGTKAFSDIDSDATINVHDHKCYDALVTDYLYTVTRNHSTKMVASKEPLCEEDGNIQCWKCDECGQLFKEEEAVEAIKISDVTIPQLGHTYGEWIVDKEATCTEDGSKHKSCICGNVVTERIVMKGHDWEKDYTTDKEATCIVEGSKSIHCSECDATKDAIVIEKTAHEYGDWIVDKKATTSTDGSKSKHCTTSGCNAKTSVTTIPKISSVKLSAANYTYNGSAKKPTVTVKNSKGTALKSGTDYTVSYASGRTKIGKYKVTVTFNGDYTGSKALYFEIGPKNPFSVKTALYGHDDVKVSWNKVSGVSGYKVYYKKSSASSWTLLKTTTATSYKKANLSDGVKYDFKVVAYKNVSGNACENAGKKASIYTLKKVVGVKAAKSSGKVKVSWTNISGETGYQISQSTSKSKTKIVATYKTTSGKYKTVSATKGKAYYYKVRAYKVVGKTKVYGPWSGVVKYKR